MTLKAQSSVAAHVDSVDERMSSVAHLAFLKAVERINDIVKREIGGVQQSASFDLSELNDQKARVLQQFSKAIRALEIDKSKDIVLPVLDELKVVLSDNLRILHYHLEAAREVSAIIAKAMIDADSDGTYVRSRFEKSKA